MRIEGEKKVLELTMEELIRRINQCDEEFSIAVFFGEESDINGREESSET